ncbi:gram-negative bacteria-binding protein 1 precursor [Moelleriella libera RCEF 2490]|uniref:Gram-negative bacteria-binding protein 1 n=1 Tax=Moelleriella libera RCEF 2490 TaxID=1081109 RepID=A0A168DBD8_9HYPO|nr:gram-negative bacteria-binding protein 1 precursor [Moelleriella libera RCEF 2490]
MQEESSSNSPKIRRAIAAAMKAESESSASSSAFEAESTIPSVHTGDYSSLDVASKRRFKSYRLRGEYEKPWLSDPAMYKTKWNNWIVRAFIVLGFMLAGVACYFMVAPYKDGAYCLIYEDHFTSLDKNIWSHEVQLDGFGTGSFDWTTTDEKNSYIDSNGLHIVPTLTNETTPITNNDLYANYTLDLGKDGSCTGTVNTSCIISSDPMKGTMIPPVRSARLSTKGKKSIRYGRVEVVAKLPRGDWIWPAIWMMPEDSMYGVWPRSGEIDIMESRGNSRDYKEGGRNFYYGTLHWGPTASTDSYWRTTQAKMLRRGDYSQGFHTYGIQWTPNYIYFYVDSRIHQIFFIGFKREQPLYDLGGFAAATVNQTLLSNPWAVSNSTTGNAPFDQKFYLILNVAVGAKNGWFLDHVGDKPWVDAGTNAQWTFWDAASKWLPTWGQGEDRGMTVRSVKMWQAGQCGQAGEL